MKEMLLSRSYHVVNVLRRALSYIDARLMRHGERVAFIAYEMAKGVDVGVEPPMLALLALLHDIGAYKTEEIDHMTHFETVDVYSHAVFGYLFLKSATGLGSRAEAILHHHTPWSLLKRLPTTMKDCAALIHIADRIDILVSQNCDDLSGLRSVQDGVFKPEFVKQFFEADASCHITERLKHDDYSDTLDQVFADLQMDEDTALQYLRMIVYAIDFRSPFTVTHTAKTVAISRGLGLAMGLGSRDMAALESGAFLHDIGKIGIPVEILEKPGKLTDAEMSLMRTHAVLTDDIIRGLVSDDVCDIASRHHEKCDGSGYPRGLTGESLTLPQRILAVADIVSALVSKRSYKDVFPKEKVLAILSDMSERGQLCHDVCRTQLTHYDAIIETANSMSDPVLREYEELQRAFPSMLAEMNAHG